jgi:hypothetical protein
VLCAERANEPAFTGADADADAIAGAAIAVENTAAKMRFEKWVFVMVVSPSAGPYQIAPSAGSRNAK